MGLGVKFSTQLTINRYDYIYMWFWYGLTAAFVGAMEVVISKKVLNKVGSALFTWSLFTLSLPLLALLSFKEGVGSVNYLFWMGTFVSCVLFVFSKTLSNESIKRGVLSKLFPLSGLGALFTYLFGLILLSEQLKPIPVLGIVLIVAGTYAINVDKAHEGIWQPIKLLFKEKVSLIFIMAIALASLSGIFDKVGLTNISPRSIIFPLLVEDVFLSLFLLAYMLRFEKNWVTELKNNFWVLLLTSAIYMVSNLLTFSGFLSGPVALTSGIKRVQILFIFLLGILVLKDKPTKHAWLAAALMISGIILLKYSP